MQSYLRLLTLIKPYKRALLLAFFCSAFYALFNAVAIWFSASFITAIFSPEAGQAVPAVSGQGAELNESLKSLAWNLIGHGDRFLVVKKAVGIFFIAFLLWKEA